MANFAYRAAKSDGALIDGHIEAGSKEGVLRELRAQGFVPLQVVEAAPGSLAAGGAARASWRDWRGTSSRAPGHRDIHVLTGELAIMLRAGIPLDRALRVLAGMATKSSVRALLDDLLGAVKGGKSLSQALAAHEAVFGEFYINMVRAGEAGGRLADVLARLAEHLERARALRENVVSALLYPAILVTVAFASVVLLLAFVIPRFETLFAEMGEALPLSTRLVIAAGDLVVDWGWLMGIAGVLALLSARQAMRSPAGRAWRDARLLCVPVLGPLMRKAETTRFARSLGTLLASGVSIVSAIRIASDTLGNLHLRAAMSGVAPLIKQGGRMSDALAATGLFTPLALNMVRLGEETGRLDEMLLELARVQDEDVQTGTRRAMTLLEPLLILGLGAVIGLIIVSVLVGILSINDLAG